MSESQDSWHRFGEEVSRIGERFRAHYRDVESGSVESGDDLRSAFDTLGRSLDRVFTSVGNAFRDPLVQDDARRAANTLVDALGDSLEEFGRSLKHLIETEEPPTAEGTWEPDDRPAGAAGDDEPAGP